MIKIESADELIKHIEKMLECYNFFDYYIVMENFIIKDNFCNIYIRDDCVEVSYLRSGNFYDDQLEPFKGGPYRFSVELKEYNYEDAGCGCCTNTTEEEVDVINDKNMQDFILNVFMETEEEKHQSSKKRRM